MTKTFTLVATLFALVELSAVAFLWFDHDATKFGPDTLAPANFQGWKLAQHGGAKWKPVERELSFYALWVGNNKFIMLTLILACAYSKDQTTRLLASFFMAFGCALYFFTMDSVMKSLDDAGDVQAGSAKTLSSMIAFLLVLWIGAFVTEVYDSMKHYRVHVVKAKRT